VIQDRALQIAHRSDAQTERVVLVVLDGVRWQDVFDGATDMPTLHRWMIEDGTCIGAPGYGEMTATGPNYVSLPSYREIFSGRAPQTCQDNHCPRPTEPTLVDELVRAGRDAVIVSSWETIGNATSVTSDVPMSTGRLRLQRADGFDMVRLADGHDANPWPGMGEYRPDILTARLAYSVFSTKPPAFLFVGLGEPDEYAHRGDRERYLASLHAADRILETLERATDNRTTFIVTADHGRSAAFLEHGAAWPESGRVWLVAKGGAIARNGFVSSSPHRLADIAPTVRVLLGLPADADRRAGQPITELLE
jgi:hypothetical protein